MAALHRAVCGPCAPALAYVVRYRRKAADSRRCCAPDACPRPRGPEARGALAVGQRWGSAQRAAHQRTQPASPTGRRAVPPASVRSAQPACHCWWPPVAPIPHRRAPAARPCGLHPAQQRPNTSSPHWDMIFPDARQASGPPRPTGQAPRFPSRSAGLPPLLPLRPPPPRLPTALPRPPRAIQPPAPPG